MESRRTRREHLSSMSSQVGLAVRTSVMNIHTLVDATWNQTASEPAAKKCNQESGNVGNQTRRSRCLCVNFGMAAWAYHVRCLRSNRDDRSNDRRPSWLWNISRIRARRWNSAHGLCVAGWCRRRRHKAIRRRSLLTHCGNGISSGTFRQYPCRWRLAFRKST